MHSNTSGRTGDELPESGAVPAPAGRKPVDAALEGHRRRSLFAALRGGPLKTAAELATILSLGVAIIAVFVQLRGSSPTNSDTAHDSDSTTPSPAFMMFDDFNGREIDPSKWQEPPDDGNAALRYVKNGKLHLNVDQQDGQGRGR